VLQQGRTGGKGGYRQIYVRVPAVVIPEKGLRLNTLCTFVIAKRNLYGECPLPKSTQKPADFHNRLCQSRRIFNIIAYCTESRQRPRSCGFTANYNQFVTDEAEKGIFY
jgi:hypothetical protein